jgi:hypothetical protein
MEAAPTPARAGAGAVLDGLLSDMRATRAFEAVRLPALTHLAAWGLDKGTCVAYGPLEVEAMQVSPRARPRGTRHAARGVCASCNQLQQEWVSLLISRNVAFCTCRCAVSDVLGRTLIPRSVAFCKYTATPSILPVCLTATGVGGRRE